MSRAYPAAAFAAIAAFDQQVALTDDEITALWPLVVLRGAVLVVSGEYQVRIDGANDYAAKRADHEWRLFEDSLTLGFGCNASPPGKEKCRRSRRLERPGTGLPGQLTLQTCLAFSLR